MTGIERFDTTRKIRTLPNEVPLELQDVAYYNMVTFCNLQDEYDLDSETDFNKFASDHYGELGLSRLNILASDFNSPGWRIIVPNSYSAYVDVAVEVATTLYKSGAPLEIHDAAKLLRILKEKDHVKLIPYTFHDYMGHHEERNRFINFHGNTNVWIARRMFYHWNNTMKLSLWQMEKN